METATINNQGYAEWDILCGRGGRVNRHSGNRVYRRLIDEKKALYRQLIRKEDKNTLLASILMALKKQGVRFLKQEGDTWIEIDDAEAMSKTSQAFREPEKKKPFLDDPIGVAAAGMLQMSAGTKRKKNDLLGDDDQDALPLQPFSSTAGANARGGPSRKGRATRSLSKGISGCHGFSLAPPTSLQEQQSRDVSSFMQNVASKDSNFKSQQSRELISTLQQISLGKVPITQTHLGTEFVKMLRDDSLLDDKDTKPSAISSGHFTEQNLSGGSTTSQFETVFQTEQERQEFIGLWKQVSENHQQTSALLKDWDEEPLTIDQHLTLPKQESIDLLQSIMRSFPVNHAAV